MCHSACIGLQAYPQTSPLKPRLLCMTRWPRRSLREVSSRRLSRLSLSAAAPAASCTFFNSSRRRAASLYLQPEMLLVSKGRHCECCRHKHADAWAAWCRCNAFKAGMRHISPTCSNVLQQQASMQGRGDRPLFSDGLLHLALQADATADVVAL